MSSTLTVPRPDSLTAVMNLLLFLLLPALPRVLCDVPLQSGSHHYKSGSLEGNKTFKELLLPGFGAQSLGWLLTTATLCESNTTAKLSPFIFVIIIILPLLLPGKLTSFGCFFLPRIGQGGFGGGSRGVWAGLRVTRLV